MSATRTAPTASDLASALLTELFGTPAFLRHPDERRRYRTDPAAAVSGIEELLRFDSPSQLTVRTALTDVEIDGRTVRRGDQVVVLRGAANRARAAFAEPHRLDLPRAGNRHLASGYGIRRCVGAALARMEARLAFGELLRPFPDITLATDRLTYRDSLLIRGPVALPVRLG